VTYSLRFGRHLSLALCCVAVVACGDRSGGNADSGASAEQQAMTWNDGATKALQDALAKAPAHGLRADMFLKGPVPDDAAERHRVLTQAALAYASALARGYVDPKSLGHIYTIPRPDPNLRTGLARALESNNLGSWLDSLAPQTEEYRAISRAYLHFRQRAAQSRAVAVPEGDVIRPGERDPRIPGIVAALQASEYLPGQIEQRADQQRYSRALVQAIQRLQRDRGFEPDGLIGRDTVAMLNRGPNDRARQLAIGLERLRWTERNPPPRRIDVNTAASFLDYYRDGQSASRRKVINGEPGWETPQLQSPIFQLVAHPIWRVPDSIYEDELAEKGPAYFAANDMVFRNGKLVQLPGDKNSLGQVKFDMKNDESIYLHDTPAKAIFAGDERHRSHGCVRVEGALDFAMMLASEDNVIADLQKGLAKEDETYIKLKREIPVRLLYRTAFFDGGEVKLVPDIYGWDELVAKALGLGPGGPRKSHVHRRGVDVGP
jgi:L,D-transpeptidase YcbB